MCDVLSDSLYPAYTAGPILHLAQRLKSNGKSLDCVIIVTVGGFDFEPKSAWTGSLSSTFCRAIIQV
jgi:hypothetical protein